MEGKMKGRYMEMKGTKALPSALLLTLLLALPSALAAQTAAGDTIRRTVLVESVYNPVLASSEKRSFLPDEPQPATHREAVVYADENHDPGNLARSPFGSGTVTLREQRLLPAYLRLGYGSRGNTDVLGLYRASLGKNDVLDLSASLSGWKGAIPYEGLTAIAADSGTWLGRRYDTDARIAYNHKGRTRFGLGADVGYYTRNHLVAAPVAVTDLLNSLWYGGDGYLTAPFRRIPAELGFSGAFHRWQNSAWQGIAQPNAENHARLDARFSYRFPKAGQLNLALTNDLLTYSNLPDTLSHYLLGFHPSWAIEGRQGRVAIGLNVDAQPTDSQRVQLSPNCQFTWTPTAPLRIDLVVDGGRDVQSFRDLYRLSPWWTADVPLQKAYTYLNARLHMGIRVAEGLHVGFGGGYRLTDNALFAAARVKNGLLYTGLVNHDARVWHAGADVSYEWKDFFRFGTDFTYYGWQGVDDNPLLLTWTPQMDWNTSIRTRIVQNLHADAAFRYRRYNTTAAGRQPSVADLSLKADYAFSRMVSLYLSGENLLNRHNGYTPVYPAQGIRAVAGVTLKL